MTIETAKFAVQRGTDTNGDPQQYSVAGDVISDKLADGDILAVSRGGVTKRFTYNGSNINDINDTDLLACTDTDGITYSVTGAQFKELFEEEVEIIYHIQNIRSGPDGSNRVSATGGDKVYRLKGGNEILIHTFTRDPYSPPTQEELEALEDILDNEGEEAFIDAYDALYDNFVLEPGYEYLVTGPLARFSGSLGQWQFGPLSDTAAKTDWTAFLALSSFNAPLSNLDFSALNKCDLMFAGAVYFNQSVSAIDTSNCTTLIGMFLSAYEFDQPVNHLVGSNITDISFMFKYIDFNQPLDAWDVSNVTNMAGAIYECPNFNQDISMWNTKSVESFDTEDQEDCFVSYCRNFDQDLSQWCVPKVTSKPNKWGQGFNHAYTDPAKYPVWGTCPRGEDQP